MLKINPCSWMLPGVVVLCSGELPLNLKELREALEEKRLVVGLFATPSGESHVKDQERGDQAAGDVPADAHLQPV